jgi:hypothetical protein
MKTIILNLFLLLAVSLINSVTAQWTRSGTVTRLTTTNDLVGIGTTAPNSKLHVNTTATGQNPFRVQVAGSTKFFVANNGGTAIGSLSTPPANGLFVLGNAGFGTVAPVTKIHVVGGSDASPAGGGYIVTGSISGANVVVDENEIMARSNGAASNLFLNHNGGNLIINGTNSTAAGGNVGIRTTNPLVEFHLFHGLGTGSTHGLRIENTGANHEDWTFYSTDADGALELYSNGIFRGEFNKNSGVYSPSDRRLKKDFEKAGNIMDKIMQLDIQKYHFIYDNAGVLKQYGMIAQDVEKIFPEAVHHKTFDDGKEIYTMNYSLFGVLAIKAVQEEHALIEAKDKQLNDLQTQVNQLQTQLDQLKSMLTAQGLQAGKIIPNENLSKLSSLSITPNPFQSVTTIRYFIPDKAVNSAINIVAVNGTVVKTYTGLQKGNGQLTINGSELSTGAYVAELIVNGQKVSSRQMVLNK